MAKKARVDPDTIDLSGKRKDALLVERYGTENGPAALPFLEQALADGSQAVRVAATTAIAIIDAERAERLVLAEIAGLGAKWKPKDRKHAYELLLAVATPTAIARFLEEGGVVKTPAPQRAHAALLAHVVARAPRADAAELRALLQSTGVLADQGSTAFDALTGAGVLLDVDLALQASSFAKRQARFAALARYVGDASGRKAVVATLTSRDDPAWISLLSPFSQELGVFHALLELRDPESLARLRAAAARDVFDAETKDACYRLGMLADEQASPILARWLQEPSASEAAPMLLTALAACGDARSLPAIERARAHATEKRRGFFDHAIRAIRARVGE